METTATLRRKSEKAADKLADWIGEYVAKLEWYETRRKGVTLKDKYGTEDVSRLVEADGIEVYEFDDDSPNGRRVKCTARAIKCLRTLEKKIDYWTARLALIEDALDAWSELTDDYA